MFKYKMTGVNLDNTKENYVYWCECESMSPYELQQWIKESGLDPDTVQITKTKITKRPNS